MNMFENIIITATTFQLKHIAKDKGRIALKCSYDIDDYVESPCGNGVITELDKETGNCKIKLDKEI